MLRNRMRGMFGQKKAEKHHYENVCDFYFYPDDDQARIYPHGREKVIEPVDNVYASGAKNVRTGEDEDGFYIWYSYMKGYVVHTVNPWGESKIVMNEESK